MSNAKLKPSWLRIPPGQPQQESIALTRDVSNKSEESILSRSLGYAGSDILAALHRRSSETTCISHSGYLLKRSNKPFCDVELSSERSETPLRSSPLLVPLREDDIFASGGTDQADGGEKRICQGTQQQPQHHVSNDMPMDNVAIGRGNSSAVKQVIDLAADFFGCDSAEDDMMRRESLSPILNGDTNMENTLSLQNQCEVTPNEAHGSQESTVLTGLAHSKAAPIPIFHRLHSAPPGMHPSDIPADNAQDSSHSGRVPPPADYIDPKDGHIWRAKYCVLEDGVLYFYRNAKDGDSIEAQIEREQMSLFHHGVQAQTHLKSNVTADDLSKSPMAGQIHPLLHAHEHGTGGSFCYDANVIWEKRVALDCVGEVRSAELEYGEKSFELLAIDYEDNPKTMDDNLEDGDSLSECKTADRLLLRAGTTEEMNEWLFQFHRSLASFMKQIVNMVGSNISGVGDLHFPAEPYHAHGIFGPPLMRANGALPIPMIPPAASGGMIGASGSYSPSAQNGGGSHANAVPAGLSHGHGRSGLHRRRIRVKNSDQAPHQALTSPMSTPGGGASPILSQDWEPSSMPRKGHKIAVPGGGNEFSGFDFSKDDEIKDVSKLEEIVSSPTRPFQRIVDVSGEETKVVSERTLVAPAAYPAPYPLQNQMKIETAAQAKTSKYVPPHLRNKVDKQSGGLTQSLSTGKYVPPHLRGGQSQSVQLSMRTEGAALSISHLPGAEATSESITQDMFEMSVDDAPKHLRPKSSNEVQCMNHSDGFGIDSTEEGGVEPVQVPEDRRIHGGRAETSHFMRGGCADPTVAIGSIVDPMYIPRKSSRVGKVHSNGYGGFGGGKPSSVQSSQQDSGTSEESAKVLNWEVGAISECGIRDSNEDSYIISHDLVAAFDAAAASEGSRDDAIEGGAIAPSENDRSDANISAAAQHYGLFAIFDGHCGNEAARYAVEKLPSLIFDEYKKDSADSSISTHEHAERILSGAIKRLDEEFCHLCTAGGREWESGATAVVTLIIGDVITVANVGDSRGVMCMSSSTKSSANGWSLLEEDENNGTGDSAGPLVYWKEVTDVHTPAREDERRRIENSNGWITTETEIPISQLQRMDFLDKDVVEILKRCFSDRFDNDPSSDPHRAGKKCSAEPGRLLHISRVCGELAVSRAIGDRDFKAAYNAMPLDTEEKDTSASSGLSAQNVDSATSGWECPLFLPYPDEHSRLFDGDLVSGTPEIQLLRAGASGVFDEFLLLACDGLWDVMDADDAVRVARGLLFEKGWSAQKAAARLAELAMHLGSSDNITVIVIRFFTEERKTSPMKVLVQ